MNYSSFNFDGKKLKSLRKKKKLSIEEVSKILGKSPRTIGSWERNERKPSLSDIRVLSDFFGIPIKEISDVEKILPKTKRDVHDTVLSVEEQIQSLFEAKLNIEQKAFLYKMLGIYRGLKKNLTEARNEVRQLQNIVNHVPIAIYSKDFFRRYQFSNKYFKILTNTDKILGKTDEQVLDKNLRVEIKKIEDKVFSSMEPVFGQPITFTEQRYTRSLSVNLHPIITNGKIESITGTIIDFTQRMNALKQYKLYENIIDSVSSVIWVRYRKPVKHMVFLNSAIERIAGISQKEFNTNPLLWLELIHPDDQKAVKLWSKNWSKYFDSGTTENIMYYRVIDINGNIIKVKDLRSYFENEDGEKVEFGIIRDINDTP